jgi:hypothetical protein
LAAGPEHTYYNGVVCTKVDYVMMDIGATSMLSSVVTREMEDLNTSDHVPLVASLLGGTKAADVATEDYTRKVSWDSIDEVCENTYVAEVNNLLQSFLGYVIVTLRNWVVR